MGSHELHSERGRENKAKSMPRKQCRQRVMVGSVIEKADEIVVDDGTLGVG
jgi:hypothetical protein